ncbi:MAG: hypothetical protein ACAH95_01385, partial [Fimbriimonas sp.]
GPNRELTQTTPQDLTLESSVDALHNYEGSILADIPGYQGYTIRVIPKHEDIAVPSELALVTWE